MKKPKSLKDRAIPLVILLVVIGLTATLFIFREKIAELGNLGYLGAFLISLISNATIVMPMPGLLLIFALGATFNPVLIGIIGGAGGALGEMTAYLAGYSGRGILKETKLHAQAERWMKKWGGLTIFAFALTPFLLFDAAGIAAGTIRYPVWKFLIACWLGRTILYLVIALAGAWGWETILPYFS